MVIHREVNDTPAKLKQRLAWVSVAFVLLDGVIHRLLGQAVLQFKGDHRQPVDKSAQIQRALVLSAEVQLARYAEAVLRMALHRLSVLWRRRAVKEVKAQSPMLDSVAQHIDHTTPRDLTLQACEELLPRHSLAVLKVPYPELGKLLGLRLAQKPEKLLHIHRILAVISRAVARNPAGTLRMWPLGEIFGFPAGEAVHAGHVAHDQSFEAFFGSVGFAHGFSQSPRVSFV